MIDILQRRVLEIALQLPGYIGYEAKERRRDMDKYTRNKLGNKYEELHAALARLRSRASLDYVADLENLDQKLLRLIARFETAPRGYAGWFDAAQIGEEDLDALTRFDAALARGLTELKTAIEKIATAVRTKQSIDEAVNECAELLDALNAEWDQREDFVAMGKKPSMSILPERLVESPLGALKAKQAPPAEIVALGNLRLKDALTFDGIDYLITGKLTYTIDAGSFWVYLLQDGKKYLWLRVGPGGEIATCQEVQLDVLFPAPATLTFERQTFVREIEGTARVSVEGASGTQRGEVDYARYTNADARLWIENFGNEARAMIGQIIDVTELKVYRR
jgi:hypothetical protein